MSGIRIPKIIQSKSYLVGTTPSPLPSDLSSSYEESAVFGLEACNKMKKIIQQVWTWSLQQIKINIIY